MKKLKYFLQHIDGIWSLPLAILLFWVVGLVLSSVFGFGTGTYDPGLYQAFFFSCGIVIGATNVTVWGLYFNFRHLYRYIYGEKDENGKWINYSKNKWKSLTPWQQFVIALSVFFAFFISIIVVFLSLV